MKRCLLLIIIVTAACSTLNPPPLGQPLSASPEEAQSYSHYLAGIVLRNTHQADEAVMEFRRASDLAPKALTLHVKLMDTYLFLQDFESALVMCRRAQKQAPNSPALWLRLGGILLRLERYDEATAAFEQLVKLDPKNTLGYQALVSLNETMNDLVGVADVYEKLAEASPDSAPLQLQLGLTLGRMNDTDGAQRHLERALELDPTLNEARLFLGIILLQAEKNEAAADMLQTYLQSAPGDAKALENLGGAYARLGRYPEAAALLGQAVLAEGAEPGYAIEHMYALLRAGKPNEVLAASAPAAPLLETLFRAIAFRDTNQRYNEVLDSLNDNETRVDEECTEFLGHLLYLFGASDAGNYLESAITGFRNEGIRVRALDLILARSYMTIERDADAEPVLLNALREYGSDRWTHYYLAGVYEQLKRTSDAETHLKACLELNPNDADVMNFLGYMYAEQNMKLDEAEQLLNRALELDPDNGYYLDSLGWLFYRKGNGAKAVELIQKAIRASENDDAILRDHLGDAYLLKGDVKNAVSQWKRARRLDPKLEGVQKKIDQHGPSAKK